jgi:UPF0755 protein
LVAIGLVLACIGAVAYVGYRQALAPASASTSQQNFTVVAGQNAQTIAGNLATAGLIRSRNAFITYVNLHGLRPALKAGVYSLSPNLSADHIANLIAGGQTLSRRLVIPEGYRLSQIESAAEAAGLSRASFTAALAAAHSQSALSSKPSTVGLEGYLFPDSYDIGPKTTASQLVTAMLDDFDRHVGAAYVTAFSAQGLTLHQGLTLASIVEREVNNAADRPVVAQIFLKRWRSGQSLGSDVTAQYAADLLGVPFSVDVNSPYNTRRFAGLPPGPICSPGLSALDAVAKPAATDYLYFLSGKNGQTYFAKTYAEHQQNIAKYLN